MPEEEPEGAVLTLIFTDGLPNDGRGGDDTLRLQRRLGPVMQKQARHTCRRPAAFGSPACVGRCVRTLETASTTLAKYFGMGPA
jgi:hypothetical protein